MDRRMVFLWIILFVGFMFIVFIGVGIKIKLKCWGKYCVSGRG